MFRNLFKGILVAFLFSVTLTVAKAAGQTGDEGTQSAKPNNSSIVREFNLSKNVDNNERLRNAAFIFLEGKTRNEAISFLVDDGFVCTGNRCARESIHKDTAAAILFGIRNPQDQSSIFGKRREIIRTFQILLPHEAVISAESIEAKFSIFIKEP